MTEAIFMRLSDDWALAYDPNQWIVCKRKRDRTKTGETWCGSAWNIDPFSGVIGVQN